MALEGNQYYLLRTTNGREKKYTPNSLLKKANEYFKWCIDNPFLEAVIVKGNRVEKTSIPNPDKKGKDIKTSTTIPYVIAQLPKMRPFTLEGFCNYADIVVNTFKNYEKIEIKESFTEKEKKNAKDFLTVTTRIRQIIDNQQFEGAAAGFLNHNIIASKLGLMNRIEHNGNADNPLELSMSKVTMVIKERKLEE